MTKLEEVARFIEAKSNYVISQHHAKALARAAVEALREPSDEISEVMSQRASNGMVDWRDLHRAMIDAILNEPTKE